MNGSVQLELPSPRKQFSQCGCAAQKMSSLGLVLTSEVTSVRRYFPDQHLLCLLAFLARVLRLSFMMQIWWNKNWQGWKSLLTSVIVGCFCTEFTQPIASFSVLHPVWGGRTNHPLNFTYFLCESPFSFLRRRWKRERGSGTSPQTSSKEVRAFHLKKSDMVTVPLVLFTNVGGICSHFRFCGANKLFLLPRFWQLNQTALASPMQRKR